MEAMHMTNAELADAARVHIDFEIAMEMIIRGGFDDDLMRIAWREYRYEMLREEQLRQQEAQMEEA